MVEEDDYLIETCSDENFAEHMQTESEQRPGAAAMFFDRDSMQASPGDTSFHRQRYGESQQSNVHSLFGSVIRGDLADAVFAAFRAVEEAVRKAGGYSTRFRNTGNWT